MPALKSPDDLRRLRAEQKHLLHEERSTGTVFYVGMGTCGIAAGAREVFRAIELELQRRQIAARVKVVGCVGMCAHEPIVDIQRAGESRVTYIDVVPEMAPRLIEEHLVQGKPVREWVIGRLPGD